MIKLLAIADVRGWAYDRRAQALKKYAPEDFEVDIAYICEHGALAVFKEFDVIYNMEYTMTRAVRSHLRNCGSKAPLVNSHNADHRRASPAFNEAREHADFIIFNNMEAFRHYGSLQGTCNISNGVDLDLWGVDVPPECRTNLAIWTGGNGKGYEEFLIPLSEACKEASFELRHIGKDGWNSDRSVNTDVVWPQPRMRDWYNGAKVVLCSSDTEATPNYLLEAMACGCVPVSTKVGNLMEFGEDGKNCCLCRKEIDSFIHGICFALENYEAMHANAVESISKWSWESRSRIFYDVFRAMINKRNIAPFTYKQIESGDRSVC